MDRPNPFHIDGIDPNKTYPPGDTHYSQYDVLQIGIQERWGALYTDFPYAAMILDSSIRNACCGLDGFQNRKIKRKVRSLSFKRAIYSLSRRVPSRADAGHNGTFLQNLSGFEWLDEKLEQRLIALGLNPLASQKTLGVGYNSQMRALATRGRAYAHVLRITAEKGLAAALSDQALMRALDAQIRQNITELKNFVLKNRIRLVVRKGESSGFARVLSYACQELNVPYVVIAHGYIQNYALVTIAPIRADYLIVWTSEQARSMSAAVGERDASKIRYFGYPKSFWPKADRSKRLAGIVWHPIFCAPKRDHEVRQLTELTKKIASAGFEIIVRLHPQDRSDADLVKMLQQQGLTMSSGKIEDDLGPASVIVGSRSSTLVEASLSGKTVFQIEEYRLNHLENVQSISLNDANFEHRISSSDTQAKPVIQQFDFDAFLQLLVQSMKLEKDAGKAAPAAR